jgi:ribosomal protein S18 acetylase RimI-like enzyme
VRHVVNHDIDAVAATLARAFYADELFEWIYPDPSSRLDHATALFRIWVAQGIRRGHTYPVDGDAAAAIWCPPDASMFDDHGGTEMGILWTEQLGDRLGVVVEGLTEMTAGHPEEPPHFYLLAIGTVPDAQGRGLGSALLDEVLPRCDRQGLGAYLEATSARSAALYERHGFRTTGEYTLPDGPTSYLMWREPRR